MSSPVERKATSAGWPAAIARACEADAHSRAQVEPDAAQPGGRALVLQLVRAHAADGGDRPLELADHVGDRDLLRRPGELVAAHGAALARHQASAAELGEDALEEL